MGMGEIDLGRHFVAEQPPSTSWRYGPGVDFFWVAPDQVAESAFVRNLLRARHDSDLVEGADLGGQAAVDTQDFAVDDGGEGEEVEDLAAGFPHRGVAVLLLAFLVEAVDLGDLAGFVVAAHEGDAVGVSVHDMLAGSLESLDVL